MTDLRDALTSAGLPSHAAMRAYYADGLEQENETRGDCLARVYVVDAEAIAKVWITKRLSEMQAGRLDGALFLENVMWDRDSESASIFAKDLLDQLFAPERGTP